MEIVEDRAVCQLLLDVPVLEEDHCVPTLQGLLPDSIGKDHLLRAVGIDIGNPVVQAIFIIADNFPAWGILYLLVSPIVLVLAQSK